MVIVIVMVVFAFAFYALEQHDHNQFVRHGDPAGRAVLHQASAATVGFGDVHAAGQCARGLVLAQMVFDVVFIGTAVAAARRHGPRGRHPPGLRTTHDAAEPQVRRGVADAVALPGRRAVAPAVVRGAQV